MTTIPSTLLSLALVFLVGTGVQHADWKSVETRGMTFKWRFEASGKLICQVEAPTEGWVALGFNTQPGLAKTNLIMAAVNGDETEISDRYIHRPGSNSPIIDLGGQHAVEIIEAVEKQHRTVVTFSIPTTAIDAWHYALVEGERYHILLAYSVADAFDHHSIMRTHIEVRL